jgi:putative transposase
VFHEAGGGSCRDGGSVASSRSKRSGWSANEGYRWRRPAPAGRGTGNSRNGTSSKTILTEDGEIKRSVARDRAGSFEPQLIAKGQTRFDGFDEKILSLYARGMNRPGIVGGSNS